MAEQRLQLILDAVDRTKQAFESAKTGLSGVKDRVDAMQPAFQKMALVGTVGLTALSGIAYKSVTAYMEAEKSAKQLEHATLNVAHGTREHLKALTETASMLQKKGVLDADAIKMGQAQLMTFGLSAEFVNKLSGSMADLAVNQFGVNAGGEELTQTANIMAKALNGQFGILEKSGIRFTDTQKRMIQFGNETERITALQEGLAQNLKFTNEVALNTLEGKLAKLRSLFGDVQEGIGGALAPALDVLIQKVMPVVQSMVEWAEANPKLITTILAVSAGIFGFLAVAGTLGLLLPSIITGIGMLGTALGSVGAIFGFIFSPIGAIVAIVGVLILMISQLDINWKAVGETIMDVASNAMTRIWSGMKSLWEVIQTKVLPAIQFLVETFVMWVKPAFDALWAVLVYNLYPAFQSLWATIQEQILPTFLKLWELLKPIVIILGATLLGAIVAIIYILAGLATALATSIEWFIKIQETIIKIVMPALNGLISTFTGITNAIKSVVDWLSQAISKLREFSSAGGGGLVGKGISKLGNLLGFDTGGIVPGARGSAQLAVVHGGETILPTHKSGFSLAGAGGVTINLTLTGNSFMGTEGVAEMIGNEIAEILKRNIRI
jgi:phage-related protein